MKKSAAYPRGFAQHLAKEHGKFMAIALAYAVEKTNETNN